jgi:hypothetical protein
MIQLLRKVWVKWVRRSWTVRRLSGVRSKLVLGNGLIEMMRMGMVLVVLISWLLLTLRRALILRRVWVILIGVMIVLVRVNVGV